LRGKMLGALVLVVFCVFASCVSAHAQPSQNRETETLTRTVTVMDDLPPGYLFTQMKTTIALTSTLTTMSHTVVDSKGNTHVMLRFFGSGLTQAEVLFWDPNLQEWVFGYQQSIQTKNVGGLSELIFASGAQNQQQIQVFSQRYSVSGISPLTGEIITQDYLLIQRLIVKVVDGDVQVSKTLEMMHDQ